MEMEIRKLDYYGETLNDSLNMMIDRANGNNVTDIIQVIEHKFLFWHRGVTVIYLGEKMN